MSYERITVERDGEVVTLTLANPEKRNVLALETMQEITAALRAVGETDALGVIIAAEGPVFSAGHNFGDMLGSSEEEVRALFDVCTEMMSLIQALPQVVIARVHALATAAGCQLVSMCDMAVAAESAAFAAPGGKGGLFCHTPMVGIARAVGRKRGLEMALTGDPIDAHTAADWGLVNRVVADALVDETAELMRRATRLATSKALGKDLLHPDRSAGEAYDFAGRDVSGGRPRRAGRHRFVRREATPGLRSASEHGTARNIATAKFDDDDPRLAEFIDNLDRLNTLGDESPGSVWRFQSESGTSVDVKAYDNPRILLNLTVWDDVESLWNYVYKTDHVEFLRRRTEWFEVESQPFTVMWWVPEGHQPTPAEGMERLEHLRANGPSPYAFSFRANYDPPGPVTNPG